MEWTWTEHEVRSSGARYLRGEHDDWILQIFMSRGDRTRTSCRIWYEPAERVPDRDMDYLRGEPWHSLEEARDALSLLSPEEIVDRYCRKIYRTDGRYRGIKMGTLTP